MSDQAVGTDGMPEADLQRCDFCGKLTESVRRIALDGTYERLRTRHVPQYACIACSEQKERDRVGC